MTKESPLYAAIVKKRGAAAAEAFLEIANDQDFARSIFILGPGPTAEKGAQGFSTLASFVVGKAPIDAVPTACADSAVGLLGALGMDPQLYFSAEDRPKIEGLPTVLQEVAQAKDEAGPLIPMIRAKPEQLREAAQRIELYRNLFGTYRSMLRILYCNLVSTERHGADLFLDDYTAAREVIRNHGVLAPKLAKTDAYVFGAAAAAAKTARDNRARDEEHKEAIQALADDDAAEKARVRTAEKLKAIAQSMNNDREETDPDPTSSKRKNPR